MQLAMLPATYLESRNTFIRLAQELGAECRSFPHDVAPDNAPPALSTDTAYLGPADAAAIVVIASGTHGVEGYAGAACQFRFMQTYAARYANSRISWLLVHAVNPSGYANDRRVTCEGVDLNRNFIDFSKPLPASAGYGAYHHLLISNYRPLPAGLWNELRLLSCALGRKRWKSVQAAITAGQYAYPDGLFFGGRGPTTSRLVWERIVSTYTHDRQRAFLLDIHSGLGKRGVGELISYLPASSDDFRQMSGWFHGSLKSMADGDSVSADLDGMLTAAFDRAVAGQSYAVGLEFGTRAPLVVLDALRADHWYHNNSSRLPAVVREQVRRKMKTAFTVPGAQWHDQLTARFDRVMQELAEGIARPAV